MATGQPAQLVVDERQQLCGGLPVAGLGLNSVTASAQFGYTTGFFKDGIKYDPAVLFKATLDPGVAPLPGPGRTDQPAMRR